MRILVPLAGKEHLHDYVTAGADELYFGFYDNNWTSKFGLNADINRMSGFGRRANPMCFEEILDLTKRVHEKGADAFVTLNSASYTEEEIAYLERYMEALHDVNIDGLIVSCPELVQLAAKYAIPTVASTMCGIYNSDIAGFYKDLGMKRMILPRDLSLSEIKDITSLVPGIEYEVFLMRNGCVFSDSNCLCVHKPERGALCGCLRDASKRFVTSEVDFMKQHEFEINDLMYSKFFHKGACGLCAMYRLEKIGITAGKIVGRADNWNGVCSDIRIAKENACIAHNCKSEKEYLLNMVFPSDRYEMCKLGMNCYYPEVRF